MNTQIREEAAEWLVEFRADQADAPVRGRFATWLRTSPEHVRAYLELLAVWEEAALCRTRERDEAAAQWDAESLIALARTEDNVVALAAAAVREREGSRSRAPGTALTEPASLAERKGTPVSAAYRPRRGLLAMAASVAALAVAIGTWFVVPDQPVYTTAVGEQRSIQLPDGSRVELNAASRLRLRFSADERIVELLSGEALFRVAKNPQRPFIAVSGATRVRAVGTEFNVNRKSSGTVVTVVEGRVAILAPQASAPEAGSAMVRVAPVEVGAGEQAIVTMHATPTPRRTNVALATAWTQQQISFDSMPLPDAAEEFNRFNTQRLIVDPALADVYVTGTFSAVDPASLSRFLQFLREQPGLEVVESEHEVTIRSNKGRPK
jgi:transmembrane sensor